MQLSIIILNYNVQHFLQICLESVQQAIKNLDAEIIVVDNQSADKSCDMVQQHFPNVKLIKNHENSGFPKGNNIGVAAAKGAYICILNPDTVVAHNTFSKILAFANNQKNLGIVGCKLIDGTGYFLPESKRGTPTPWVAFTKIFSLYKISDVFGKYYAQHLTQNQTGKVDILVGAFMFMKRKLYTDLGGFDENCFMYSDDIDLSYMALQKGLNNYYFHETTIIHYKGESTIKDETYMKRFQQAMNFFYKKHFKISLFFKAFMQIGIILFSIFKRTQGKSKSKSQPIQYVLISENQNLKQKLETKLQKPIQMVQNTQSISLKPQTEVIFDNNFIAYKTIIETMATQKNKNITFKIKPQNADFVIGSNSSLDKGEVIFLD
jgi:GT2 family glycosyltransferase